MKDALWLFVKESGELKLRIVMSFSIKERARNENNKRKKSVKIEKKK